LSNQSQDSAFRRSAAVAAERFLDFSLLMGVEVLMRLVSPGVPV
jgi:hypothetical protein